MGKFSAKSGRLIALGILAGLVWLVGLGGCGGVSTVSDGARVTTTVIVECLIEGTEDFIEVPADVAVGGVRGQTNLRDNWVILPDVPLGSEDPPQQPLTATAPGYVTSSQMLALNEYSYTAVSLPMKPADRDATGTVSGTVTSSDSGAPIVNALVNCLPVGAPLAETIKGFTDRDGFYIIGGIPAGQVEVTCQAVGYLEGTVTFAVKADTADGNAAVNFALVGGQSAVTVGGQVLETRTEAPVAGATVQIGIQPPVTSGPDGSFSVPGVPIGEQPVVASAAGYDDYYTVIGVVPGLDDLRILLTEYSPQPPGRPYTITGQVTLLGAPDSSGALVTAFHLDRGTVLAEDTTNAEGYYYLFVPPGPYRIEVTYGGHSIGREVELGGGGRVLESINFTLTVD